MEKKPFKEIEPEEREERLKKTLAGMDLTKGFVNLFEEFIKANQDVSIGSVSEFSEFIKSRKK